LAPVERFLAVEAASGILLLAAAAIALIWANSPWAGSYERLWRVPFELRIGSLSFQRDLLFWINDGLMTIFFFVVGLEIRREIHRGELSEIRRAMLPLVAAVGGMLVPACLFLALNYDRPSARGWGIPMATDIAFAVGVLALLGRRVPPALRMLLLTLAVVDDVGAILVIALFYSSGIVPVGLLVLAAGLGMLFVLQKLGVRIPLAYAVPALVVWAGAYAAAIHPALAGVMVGLMTPVRAWLGARHFLARAHASVDALREQNLDEPARNARLSQLGDDSRDAVSPVERLEQALHGWVAFGIMPVFALANAGVPLGGASVTDDTVLVFLGITLGFGLGKPLGIVGFSWACVRLGIAVLPKGTTWAHVGLVGVVAGIGFTMAIFVAQLAFPTGALLQTAKLAILGASVTLAILAYAAGHALLPTRPPE
jgi:NhaA family Na+:H+ antiporter